MLDLDVWQFQFHKGTIKTATQFEKLMLVN